MKRVLIIRFSAMGDVAMTVPIVYACASAHPDVSFTVMSRSFLQPLFARMPANVTFKGVNLKDERYKGLRGLNRLYRELREEGFDAVADLHDVLRTKYLRLRFSLAGKPVAHILKGRKEKKRLTRPRRKVLTPLKTSFNRYAEVLQRLGLPFCPSFTSLFPTEGGDWTAITPVTGEKGAQKWVGIAPFAAHRGKEYGVTRLTEVIALLAERTDIRIFIFGAGAEQQAVAERWHAQFPAAVTPMIGRLTLEGELNLISHLDVLLSMDSANMHLASLTATPVVSVWGATHPYAGFMGWGQSIDNAVQLDMPCRPCSVYGNKPCAVGDYPCLNEIAPERVVAQLNRFIGEEVAR